jgi:hypothetical protein
VDRGFDLSGKEPPISTTAKEQREWTKKTLCRSDAPVVSQWTLKIASHRLEAAFVGQTLGDHRSVGGRLNPYRPVNVAYKLSST